METNLTQTMQITNNELIMPEDDEQLSGISSNQPFAKNLPDENLEELPNRSYFPIK